MTQTEIEQLFRDEAGRALATLIRLVGDFDLAQDALQDAFAVALERWPDQYPPSNPRAWLVNVGRNKAIDRVRRQIAFRGKQDQLTREIELGRLLNVLVPGRGEIKGLLALMLLHDARRAGRETAAGDIVLLEEQDRSLWDFCQIAEGLKLVEEALRMPGPPQAYAVQAAIAALHARAPNYEDTDWRQIAGLYEVLLRINPSPVIELNHAAAVSMVDGPARALDLIDAIEARGALGGYELMPAVRADLLRRLGRHDAARVAYLAASEATQLEPLRRLYTRRLAELDGKS